MNKAIIFFLSLFLSSCQYNHLTIQEPSGTERKDELVILPRGDIEKTFGKVPENQLPVAKNMDGEYIPCQADDMDLDGQWDELAVLVNLGPGEEKQLSVVYLEEKNLPDFTRRTNLHFAPQGKPEQEMAEGERLKTDLNTITSSKFQMEGPAWENDIIAFRNYFDARNGIDIFGKRTPEMVLKGVGTNDQNYHELDNWGMDILKVGTSLGAGSIALMVGDSLYRVGPDSEGTYKKITEGPVRSIFRLSFKNMEVQGQDYTVHHDISIQAGKRYFKSEVTIEGLTGKEKLVTGIVNKDSEDLYLAGPTNKKVVAYTHDKQAIEGEYLGMGLILPKEYLVDTLTAPEKGEGITETYLVILNPTREGKSTYYFHAGWELENEKFAQRAAYEKTIVEAAGSLANPVKVIKK